MTFFLLHAIFSDMKMIELYFDFLSPFSYMALKLWQRDEDFWQQEKIRLNLLPVSMIPLIKSWETKGPAEIPAKRDFLFRQLLRQSCLLQIPFMVPKNLPFMSQPMIRLVAWAQICAPAKAYELVQGLFDAAWANGLDVDDEEILKKVWMDCGLELGQWDRGLEIESRREVQEKLRSNLANAKMKGIFGVPTWMVGEELFWGADSLNELKRSLLGQDLLDQAKYERYLGLVYGTNKQSVKELQ